MKDVINNFLETFPSPLGVYRFMSKGMYIGVTGELAKLPSPLEVDRVIS